MDHCPAMATTKTLGWGRWQNFFPLLFISFSLFNQVASCSFHALYSLSLCFLFPFSIIIILSRQLCSICFRVIDAGYNVYMSVQRCCTCTNSSALSLMLYIPCNYQYSRNLATIAAIHILLLVILLILILSNINIIVQQYHAQCATYSVVHVYGGLCKQTLEWTCAMLLCVSRYWNGHVLCCSMQQTLEWTYSMHIM